MLSRHGPEAKSITPRSCTLLLSGAQYCDAVQPFSPPPLEITARGCCTAKEGLISTKQTQDPGMLFWVFAQYSALTREKHDPDASPGPRSKGCNFTHCRQVQPECFLGGTSRGG